MALDYSSDLKKNLIYLRFIVKTDGGDENLHIKIE